MCVASKRNLRVTCYVLPESSIPSVVSAGWERTVAIVVFVQSTCSAKIGHIVVLKPGISYLNVRVQKKGRCTVWCILLISMLSCTSTIFSLNSSNLWKWRALYQSRPGPLLKYWHRRRCYPGHTESSVVSLLPNSFWGTSEFVADEGREDKDPSFAPEVVSLWKVVYWCY